MTSILHEMPSQSSTSRRLAAEFRGELGRQGITQTELARRLHVSQAWTSRRLGVRADVDMTFEDAEAIAEALGVSAERLVSWWLPRLDSNQQPSGYLSMLVSASEGAGQASAGLWPAKRVPSHQRPSDAPAAQVIDLDDYRAERLERSA